jgi:hypothetical protein
MLDTRIKTSDEVEEEALAYISENRWNSFERITEFHF